ncbi:hypothetical protein EB796_023391 [Bugula neritina]|uniref:Uncharacterized protein n=1 Tax=Bugula neritina TaxID=10212 RepID=A0A7J7IWW5_BUGNE|nr:hypothetical protein EB796_023391 [Bugula neritina]
MSEVTMETQPNMIPVIREESQSDWQLHVNTEEMYVIIPDRRPPSDVDYYKLKKSDEKVTSTCSQVTSTCSQATSTCSQATSTYSQMSGYKLFNYPSILSHSIENTLLNRQQVRIKLSKQLCSRWVILGSKNLR